MATYSIVGLQEDGRLVLHSSPTCQPTIGDIQAAADIGDYAQVLVTKAFADGPVTQVARYETEDRPRMRLVELV